MKKLLVFLFSLSLLNVCMAQEASLSDTSKTFKKNGFGFHLIFTRFDFSPEIKLNSLLQQNGYPGIGNLTFNIWGFNNFGLGAQYRIGMLNMGFDIMSNRYIGENEIERTEIKNSVINVNFLLSYYLKKIDARKGGDTMYLYPFIGFSSYQSNLFLTRPSTSKPINDLLVSNC